MYGLSVGCFSFLLGSGTSGMIWKILMRRRVIGCINLSLVPDLGSFVRGKKKGAALSDKIFWVGIYFLRDTLSMWVAGEGVVELGDVYGNLVVRLRVGCCISKPRDD